MTADALPGHADGYQWLKDVISHRGGWALRDPSGQPAAHVYLCCDATWRAVWHDGDTIADGLATGTEARRAVDAEQVALDAAYARAIVRCLRAQDGDATGATR